MTTASLAMLLHMQKKYKEAEPLYVLALERWNRVTKAPKEWRQKAVEQTRRRLDDCQHRRPTEEWPVIEAPPKPPPK